jgi:enoyl-CoA hydratase/carnithine racemase
MIAASIHDGVAELALDRPPANALDTAFVTAIAAAHDRACAGGARAVVLAGRPGMFSGGLDVPALIELPRAAIEEFWRAFFRLLQALASSPVPVVAAIGGHAPAGGAVLAIHCDYRIAAGGSFRIGLNEVAVGLPVPAGILAAVRELVGPRIAQRLAMTAELLTMDAAAAIGLVDEVVEPGRVLGRAHEFARHLVSLPPLAMNATRRRSREALVRALEPEADARRATEAWFSDETQAGMRALVARLRKK